MLRLWNREKARCTSTGNSPPDLSPMSLDGCLSATVPSSRTFVHGVVGFGSRFITVPL